MLLCVSLCVSVGVCVVACLQKTSCPISAMVLVVPAGMQGGRGGEGIRNANIPVRHGSCPAALMNYTDLV